MWPQIVHFSQRKQSDLDSPCLQVSVDACVRSTEFGKLSYVREIIHRRSESLAATCLYSYIMREASKDAVA